MDASLLATKLRIPPQTHALVGRDRLVDILERGITNYKLILLSAAAGYGKTTLLSQWAHASQVRVAWLTLGEEENDPDRFFRSLLAAWEMVQPGIRDSALGLLLGAIEPEREAVLAAFINVASDIPDHTAFVLDDAHLIAESSIYEALTYLLDHLPPTLHFVLAGRADPPLPLARYRARRELLELRTGDLQFQVEETAELLHRQMGLDFGDDAIVSLHEHLEGWVTGLQLVSLTRQRQREADPLAISGQHRFIADYLSEDILAHLPGPLQRFLLQTSILDRLSGPLCDAVTQGDDSQQTLERLERDNLFLVPLDETREWFRYHRLFASFLQAELRRRHPEAFAALHRRAARWYLERGLPELAFQHAIAGDDRDLVNAIFDRYESVKLHSGELNVVQGWLNAIPEGWFAEEPMLGLVRAGALAFSGELDACVRCIDDVERRLAPVAGAVPRWQQARVTAFRCFIDCFRGDLDQAELHAGAALRDLREEDRSLRTDIYQALGETYRGHGRWEEARAHYVKALDSSQAPADGARAAHIFGALADLDLRQGRLRSAAASWQKALAAVEKPANWGRLPRPVIGWVYLRRGELLYERNELAEAEDHIRRGLEHAEVGGDVRALIAGYVLASRLALTAGDVEGAAGRLEQARPLVEQASFPEWSDRFERCQLEVWLTQNRLRAAVEWADRMQRENASAKQPDRETAHLALARVLIVKGDLPARERAWSLLDRLLQTAEVEGRLGVQIEALALQALALWQGGERAGALVPLERALRLAESEGYVRLFADLGLPMARLLQEARSRKVLPEYVATLLAACGADTSDPASREGTLPEPLSQREQDVLRLVAAGLTNREIAEALFISAETVKKHTGRIYAKLRVGHRTEAIARARELDLLADPR